MIHAVTAVCIAAAAWQLLYCLLFYSRLMFYRYKSTDHALPPVTVLICAKDEARNLRNHLPLICNQDYPNDYEVLVVNDNSEDDTMELLFDLGRQYERLDYRTIPKDAKVLQGKKFALTIGMKAAKYPNVILTDADCKPASSLWLRRMASCFSEQKKVVLGYGAYEKHGGLLNALIRYETFTAGMNYLSFALAGMPYMGVGRNLGYTKQVFFSTNVFVKNPRLVSGDDDLLVNAVATKANTAVCLHKDALTLSQPKLRWDEWLAQKRRHVTTAMHYKAFHRALLFLYQLAHVLFYLSLALLLLYTHDYRLALAVFGVRFVVMGLVKFFAMRKLGSLDLFPWWPALDALYLVYYALMLPGVFNKKQSAWK